MDEITLETKSQMDKTIDSLKNELVTIRTGRASPVILDRVECDYYGDRILINQISSISSPEPRQLVVKPYDRNDLKSIAAGIGAANLGFNPIVEADCIRIIIPALTEETRRELVKKARSYGEQSKVAIRNIRRDYLDLVKSSDEISDDLKKRIQDEIQDVTDEHISAIENIIATKEKEIMAI